MASASWRNKQELKKVDNDIARIESRGGRASQSDYTRQAELRTNQRDLDKQ